MRRHPLSIPLAAAVVLGGIGCACAGDGAPGVVRTGPPAAPPPVSTTTAPPPAAPKPPKLDTKKLTKAIDRYLDGRPLSLAVRDRTTGLSYRYHPERRFVTASCAKVDIVMALLLRRQKGHDKLSSQERALAEMAIRTSDNKAADRLWERAGGPGGVAAANKKFGLKRTRTVAGKCEDLYCWGITDTTASEQVKLLDALVRDGGPLAARNRAYVLDLMSSVAEEQAWGVSAAALKSEREDDENVALKNGWQRRLSHGKLWAVNSIGRVRTAGHDLLIAVLSDHHPTSAAGIEVVEHVAELVGAEFRRAGQ